MGVLTILGNTLRRIVASVIALRHTSCDFANNLSKIGIELI